jgi:hypothetical protein
MLPADPLSWAIKQFRDDGLNARYDLYLKYADGQQSTRLSQPHYDRAFGKLYEALTYNRCKAVIDTIADRVKLTGFQVKGGGTPPSQLDDIWDENRMDKREGEVNQEFLTTGDAYVIVWPDVDTGIPQIDPNDASMLRVLYDDEHTGRILMAAKLWRTEDEYVRLNLYLPDRLEKYISKSRHKSSMPSTGNAFEQFQPDGDLLWPLIYDWFQPRRPSLPVFHFANNARTSRYGRSELKDVIQLQDGINFGMAALISSIEHEGYKQKNLAGAPTNWAESGVNVGRDSMLVVTDPQAKFGQFEAGDLASLIQSCDHFDVLISRVSKIPVHYLMLSGDFPSGESLKTADTPIVRKAEDIQTAAGNDWEDAAAMSLRQSGLTDPPRLEAQYRPAEPRSDMEEAQRAVMLKQAGWPLPSILRELDKTDDEIAMILNDRQSEIEMAQRAFDSGNTPANPDFGNQQQPPPQQGAQQQQGAQGA